MRDSFVHTKRSWDHVETTILASYKTVREYAARDYVFAKNVKKFNRRHCVRSRTNPIHAHFYKINNNFAGRLHFHCLNRMIYTDVHFFFFFASTLATAAVSHLSDVFRVRFFPSILIMKNQQLKIW